MRARSLEPLRAQLSAGQQVRFLLRANPVHSVRDGNRRRRVLTADPDSWLRDRLAALTITQLHHAAVSTLWRGRIPLRTVRYTGIATVDDPDRLWQLVEAEGVARQRDAHGTLTSLAPLAGP